ncbi:MAG: glutamate-5-semialdehyde dehydrogenase [Barnesiella sp.]|nr:glutamate-5-semialdehyde dehydrogenase [Barnesiella sp.]
MIEQQLIEARKASRQLLSLPTERTNEILVATADALVAATDDIIRANALDLSRMDPADPKYDRLKLTAERIAGIAADMRNVATLPSPRRELDHRVRPNGLVITRVAVPFGVIGVIYEARPNVTADVFSLCFKSGNACVLKGGHDADDSNRAIIAVIHSVLERNGISPAVATLLPATREATDELLAARGFVDLIIPRGSRRLIDSVREKSRVPVIETGAGVCHCYVDASADIAMARDIVNNAKTRRVSVCNALDCVIVNSALLDSLETICEPLAASKVVVHADERSYDALSGRYPAELLVRATEEDFGTEYLSYAMAVKTVDNLDEALDHIARYGLGHSESVVTADEEVKQRFATEVDAACVYTNAPTSWTDGAQFGLGAEIGISTQKMHARGPMALAELMTYKWIITGNGQTRS